MKRSQMEIMGLAIIVILISLGLLFYVRFVAFEDPKTPKDNYKPSALASNFLNTMLNTNSPDCTNTQFDTLFIDCSTHNYNGGNIPCGDPYSCEYLQTNVADLLEKSLGDIGYEYYFIATTNKDNLAETSDYIIDPIGEPCEGRKARSQPLPTFPSGIQMDLYLHLHICQ